MKARDFDHAFDEGDDIEGRVEWSAGHRPNLDAQPIEIDFPKWTVEGLDRQAQMLGLNSRDLVKIWIAERLS